VTDLKDLSLEQLCLQMGAAENSAHNLEAVVKERMDEMQRIWKEIRRRVGA